MAKARKITRRRNPTAALNRRIRRDVEAMFAAVQSLPKMSDTLLAFAEPLLDTLPPGTRADGARPMFLVAALVWNHALFADDADAKARRRELVDELARRGMPRDAGEDLVDELTLRKEFVFRHDPRFIEHVEVFDGELGEVRVRCAFTL